MKLTSYAFFLLLSASCFSQVHFENGYFIDNQNVRTDCLIKNIDYNDTPTQFEYKLSENDVASVKRDFEVREYAVGESKFVSVDVDIDQSSENLNRMSTKKNPEFEKKRTFLKVLADGSSKLYHFGSNDFQRFFYSVDNGTIQQLIYKRYYIDFYKIDVATNNTFRQQLWTNVKCDNISIATIEKLQYNRSSLTKYFESINLCKGDKVAAKSEGKKGSFNLKASVMGGIHSFSMSSPLLSHDFGSKEFVTFGIEAEYVLPIRNNKWSVIFEPTFNSFKTDDPENDNDLSVTYKYIQLSGGFRHYFFLAKQSKIFVNAQMNYAAMSSDSDIKFDTQHYNPYLFGSNSITFALGAGYNIQRFYFELRYNTKSNPSPYGSVEYSYKNSEVIIRYRFL